MSHIPIKHLFKYSSYKLIASTVEWLSVAIFMIGGVFSQSEV